MPSIRSMLAALLSLALVLWATYAPAQIVNFKPLERGEYTEAEEQLTVLRGLSVSLDYAASLDRSKYEELSNTQETTSFNQDFRLALQSVFHRDVDFLLSIEPSKRTFEGTEFRQRSAEDGKLSETQSTSVNLREAYLRYRFNPGSGLVLGKQELSIGDRRGKVFNGIAPAITYDCKLGTWCMPFGGIKIGQAPSDWILHWALDYTAWDNKNAGYNNDTFKVEIFRIIYSESNVPLGKNHGPAFYNAAAPDSGSQRDSSQAADSLGNPIYYDADSQDYFGFRLGWESGAFFLGFDFTSNQGDRRLHRYKDSSSTSVLGLTFAGTEAEEFSVAASGTVWETELGYRTQFWRIGLRILDADGDANVDPSDPADFLTGANGYHEVTPGSYQGTRLYFNGTNNTTELGTGLGHSVNNIFMVGFFYEYSDPTGKGVDYSLGITKLQLNDPITDQQGSLQSNIGLEVNNVLSFYLHKAIKLQIELNAIDTQGAFTVNDFSRPIGRNTSRFTQGATRLIYRF